MGEKLTIVSGGQTGADRAALDFALEHGIACRGWCPKGRKAEDGPISLKYPLRETSTEDYAERTEKNVMDSDGTAVFSIAATLAGGSKRTLEFAVQHSKPVLHLFGDTSSAAKELETFVKQHRIRALNIAGPRASEEADVGRFVREVLMLVF